MDGAGGKVAAQGKGQRGRCFFSQAALALAPSTSPVCESELRPDSMQCPRKRGSSLHPTLQCTETKRYRSDSTNLLTRRTSQ